MLKEAYTNDYREEVSNPIDGLEEIMMRNDWAFDRFKEDELSVQVTGKMGEYQMLFVWQEDYSAVQFSCSSDQQIHESNFDQARIIMTDINSELWLGHFDIKLQDGPSSMERVSSPCFRHTTLMRGMIESSGVELMEDLIDVALSECERYHMTFELLSKQDDKNAQQLSFAMMDVVGSS